MLRRIARRARGTDRGLGAPRKPTRYVSGNGIRRAIVTRSKLSRLGQVKYAVALLTALVTSGAIRAHAAGGTSCVIAYPFDSSDPRTSVDFNESEVLRAFSPQQTVNATPGLTIKVWYNDEHALTLGVRRVIVKTHSGTTATDYPVAALPSDPGSVLYPQVGTTALDGAQAGTDTSACNGDPDLCDRPMFPALFITDISSDPNSTAGDWQHGGTPIPPHAVFGTWKAAVRTVDNTKSPAAITVTPDSDPARNRWNLDGGDPAPSGLHNQGYGAEVRWNVDDLAAAGQMIMGHTYRLEFMVHDGDQNQRGGDTGENCVGVRPTCATAADCDDQNPCTSDSCNAGLCQYTLIAGCRLCSTAVDCNDQNACTTDSCSGGVCQNTAIAGCTPCTTASDCNDGNACTIESCAAGVCHNTAITCPSDTCTTRTCNGTSSCTVTPTTGAACDDGNTCTFNDTCNSSGQCVGTAITCTSDTCNTRSCNGTSSCTVTPLTGTSCDDGNACTFNDTCTSGGQCVGTMITCTSDQCNTRTCNGTASCAVTPLTGTSCDDGNACTAADTCQNGTCVGDAALLDGAACDDENACTSNDTCQGGVCAGTPEPDSTPCDDGPGCTTGDSCQAGTCTGTPAASGTACEDDGNVCSADACDGSGRCIHPPANAGAVCHTATDACDAAETCTGTSVYCPPDAFQPADTPCDDGNACTFNDVCDGSGQWGGPATAGCTLCTTAADCDDQNACTTDSCDGVCHNTALAGCTPCSTPADCNDQNACTTDTCDAGVCHNTAIAGCTPCSTASDCNDQND